jgi:hypothetical protein
MNARPGARPICGDRLSCYTASIAAYMELAGIDHQLALGTQLFLAVRCQAAPTLRFSFVHYHTPLLGRAITHELQLVRHWAADPATASQRISAHCASAGAVLVVGDAMNLPWLVTFGRKHTPHWFLVTAVDEQAGKVSIVDQFAFIDEAGTQEPFAGWLDLASVGAFAQSCPLSSHIFQSRDTWAFGAQAQLAEGDGAAYQAYQWFEAATPPTAFPVARTQALELLGRTALFHTGQQSRADLPAPDWACGLAAIGFLADCFQTHLENPDLYAINDDVWVAARNRELFANLLERLGAELEITALNALSAWCMEQLVPQWYAVPRIMRYNLGVLQRGRRPTALLVETLTKIADLEAQAMERLGGILSEARLPAARRS